MARKTYPPNPDTDRFFATYAGYAQTLRTWLVAYGVGGPVLIYTNDALSLRFASSPRAKDIVFLFLLGVSAQVVLAFVNKWAAWTMYAGMADAPYKRKFWYRFWDVINDQAWIDVGVDLLSIASFTYATWLSLTLL